MDFSRFEALTFDCYGTLVDWESGILDALGPVLVRHGVTLEDREILELYAELEPAEQEGDFKPYRTVLRGVVDALGRRLEFTPDGEERNALVDSLGDWPVFDDTVDALKRLEARFRLGIVSNIDNDLMARTLSHLPVDFSVVVSAQDVGGYKPSPGHFREALRRLELTTDQVLHVAQSLHHDIGPASELGFTTVRVHRRSGRQGFGATPEARATPDLEVSNLATLADLAGA